MMAGGGQSEMDQVAQQILDEEILRLRYRPYSELTRYLEPYAFEVTTASGRVFQVEIAALWDDNKGGDLRIVVAIDDSRGWRLHDYKRESFIIAPDGSFVGESQEEGI